MLSTEQEFLQLTGFQTYHWVPKKSEHLLLGKEEPAMNWVLAHCLILCEKETNHFLIEALDP